MRRILSLALRNIFRNKRRTGITFMAIISGVVSLIIFGGFIEYTFWGLRELTIKTQLGHIQIYKEGYWKNGIAEPSKYLIENPETVEKAFSGIPNIATVTRRLTFSGLISTKEKTLPCKGIGIVVEKESQMNDFESIIDGKKLEAGDTDGGIVGYELMKALGAKVGDYLTILTTTPDGIINAVDFKVVGVAQTGSQDYDSVFVKLPIETVEYLLSTTAAERIIIFLKDTKDVAKVASVLQGIINKNNMGLELKTWSELADFYWKVVGVYHGIFNVMKIIIAAIALFSIANTITMSVYERVREIGTMRAIGTPRSKILTLFITEGALVGALGGLLGIFVGILIAKIVNISGGIYISPPPGMSKGYVSFILIVPKVVFYAFSSIVGVAILSSIYPAYRASRLKIVEALQHI
jgi:putative ABC transport system permease protein